MDILIIDDIQFFSGKKGTQDVFFHVFNFLHQNRKQIILTCDKSPIEIKDVEKRLLSRFKWGLNAKIEKPNFETKLSILKNKLDNDGLLISSEIIEYVANNINSNIRELEGVAISIIAYASFDKRKLDLKLAKEIISRYTINTNEKKISFDLIKNKVANFFNIDITALDSKTRKREIVQARQIAMYLAKKHLKYSLSNIGKNIGNKNYATVLYSCKEVENLILIDKKFNDMLNTINKSLED